MRKRPPEHIGVVLPAVMKEARRQSAALQLIRTRWPGWVGRARAERARPISVRRSRLVVQADLPGDAHFLSYQRERLLEAVQAATGGMVKEIIVRPGGGPHPLRH